MKVQIEKYFVKARVIPAEEKERTVYVCEICNNSYTSEICAKHCEQKCKAMKEFLANNKPKFDIGDIVTNFNCYYRVFKVEPIWRQLGETITCCFLYKMEQTIEDEDYISGWRYCEFKENQLDLLMKSQEFEERLKKANDKMEEMTGLSFETFFDFESKKIVSRHEVKEDL